MNSSESKLAVENKMGKTESITISGKESDGRKFKHEIHQDEDMMPPDTIKNQPPNSHSPIPEDKHVPRKKPEPTIPSMTSILIGQSPA